MYVGGYYRRTPNGKFTLMTVAKAGHYVPTDALEVTKNMLYDMVFNQTLQCHSTDGCGTRKISSLFLNHCTSHGITNHQNGMCTCDKGWAGADCAKRVQVLTGFYNTKTFVNGALWTLYGYDEGLVKNERYELVLQSDNTPMDVYLIVGSSIRDREPSEFNYDVVFRQ